MTKRIAVIGLGQRIAHVLAAMKEVGWDLDLAGYVDPAPVGLPILAEAGILPGRAYRDEAELLADGPFDLVMIGIAQPPAPRPPGRRLRRRLSDLQREADRAHRAESPSTWPAPWPPRTAPPLFIGLVMRSMPIWCAR